MPPSAISCSSSVNSSQGDHPLSRSALPAYCVEEIIGDGPSRFAPTYKVDAITELSADERAIYGNLRQRWEKHCNERQEKRGKNKKSLSRIANLSDEWFLRFLRHTASSKDRSFREDRAFSAMTKAFRKDRFIKLRVASLKEQLETKTLFPVPGLKSKKGCLDMFYMRPSRYFPRETSTQAIIDNLVYVMNSMLVKKKSQKEGIGFIACMNDWTMKNFDVNYCYQFMMALQGSMVPVKVQLFLIVNPPAWFGAIWRIMKPMLAPSFRRKVKICTEDKISDYLKSSYRKYLPDDFATGHASTDQLVSDFITYRSYVEGSDGVGSVCSGDDCDEDDYEIDLCDFGSGRARGFSCDSSAEQSGTNSTYEDEDDASIHADIEDGAQDVEKWMSEVNKEIDDYFLDTGW